MARTGRAFPARPRINKVKFAETQTFVVTPTGGITFAGDAGIVRTTVVVPAGGITFAGTGAHSLSRVVTPAGGITFSGAATLARTFAFTPTGELLSLVRLLLVGQL